MTSVIITALLDFCWQTITSPRAHQISYVLLSISYSIFYVFHMLSTCPPSVGHPYTLLFILILYYILVELPSVICLIKHWGELLISYYYLLYLAVLPLMYNFIQFKQHVIFPCFRKISENWEKFKSKVRKNWMWCMTFKLIEMVQYQPYHCAVYTT